MSIIYEALKKAESQKKNSHINLDPQAFGKNNKPVKVNLRSKKKSRLPWFFALFLLSGIFLLAINKSLEKKAAVRSFIIENDSSGTIKISEKKPFNHMSAKAGTVNTKSNQGYNLEGIVYDSREPFAVVNGTILKKEDKLDELVVTDITNSEVKFYSPKDKRVMTLGISF
ncbi:MAG: hypothetical protein JW867_05320 [Candidatus Omnitrophica bacterium]|nr:hypothetical protein [Candidatus Omnitrophota bacterium]